MPGQGIQELIKQFLAQDAARRYGQATGPGAATTDRENEGALMAGLMGPAAPLATVPVGMAGAGYEGAKWLGQKTGLGESFPGTFKQDETTSPASFENILALLKGFTNQAGQEPPGINPRTNPYMR